MVPRNQPGRSSSSANKPARNPPALAAGLKCGYISIVNRNWLQFFKTALSEEPPLHPVEVGMAKKYIKKRLTVVYPQLRDDPQALERAYQSLSLEPRAGQGSDEAATVFEMILPEGLS